MKSQKTLPSITGALLLSAAFLSTAVPRAPAQTVGFASTVVDYAAGTGISSTYTNASSALGKPGGNVDGGTLNPFVPNYRGTELTGIGVGGQLTLGLSNFVTVGPAGTREIGIFGNVGIVAASSSPPTAGSPAAVFGLYSVLISVSADGVHFVPLNGGSLITSTLPANYYTNPDTTNYNAAPPTNPTFADFGLPFTGSLSDFNGETYAQTLATLNGSAGGTWLDLSSTGLSQVGYIRFNEPTSGGKFYLNGVSSNGALTTSLAVPEPGAMALLAIGGFLALAWRCRRRVMGVTAGLAVAACWCCLAGSASAQMLGFGDIKNWTGTGSNEAALVVDWFDGKSPESLVWGYRFNGTATGLQMIQAIDAADPRLAVFYAYGGGFIYGIGYDLDNHGGTFTPGMPGYDANMNSTETGSASDPADHYAEGSFTKYWVYLTSDANPYGGGGTWTYSGVGAGSRNLVNGSWDAYSISDADYNYANPAVPTAAAAVPEPSTLLAGGLALVVMGGSIGWRRSARQPVRA